MKLTPGTLRALAAISLLSPVALGCDDSGSHGSGGGEDTTLVGTFDGLFDNLVSGLNYAYDLAIVPYDDITDDDNLLEGDILLANYGTSEILLAENPAAGPQPSTFFDGAEEGFAGPMAVSVPPEGTVWAAFEQGGQGDHGGVVVLSEQGQVLNIIDDSVEAGAFDSPGGLCYGGHAEPDGPHLFFLINKGDGTAWRIAVSSAAGDGAELTRVGSGLATGTTGNPGTPPEGVINKNDLPVDGARGCAYLAGRLYVADAQNAQIVRFDDADIGEDVAGVELEDTPAELVTYPTGVTINNEGTLIVMSADNAHAFVALETPGGGFIDNGLHDLNVNSGNFGTQVGDGTIWFTRANNTNGQLRAITANQSTPPTSGGVFPSQ